jgi:hypothetical protein
MLSLPANRFCYSRTGIRIKRESGENPGQSRCCETLIILKTILPLDSDREGYPDESQSEDLPFNA